MAQKEDGSKVLGKGAARKAAEDIKSNKKRKQSRLSIVMDEINAGRGKKN